MPDTENRQPTTGFLPSEVWLRVRVGLAGIGGILLILGAASSLADRLRADGNLGAKSTANVIAAPSEPMAELGIAPDVAPSIPKAEPQPLTPQK